MDFQLTTLLAICFTGLVGNLLCVLTFARKRFAKFSFRLLFVCMSISDSLLLASLLASNLLAYEKALDGLALAQLSVFLCKVYPFVIYVAPATSAWFIGTFRFYLV